MRWHEILVLNYIFTDFFFIRGDQFQNSSILNNITGETKIVCLPIKTNFRGLDNSFNIIRNDAFN